MDEGTVAIALPARADAADAALTRGWRLARDLGLSWLNCLLVIGPSRLLRRLIRGTTEWILDANRPFAVIIVAQGTSI